MDLGELERCLQMHPVFRDLDRWAVMDTMSGLTSPHTYRFQLGDQDLFVKEAKANEKRILRLLSTFNLKIAPAVVYPELLEQDILSDICRDVDRKEMERWLYVATCAGFAGFTLWRLEDLGYVDGRQDKAACRALLEYEYPAYEGLLTRMPF